MIRFCAAGEDQESASEDEEDETLTGADHEE